MTDPDRYCVIGNPIGHSKSPQIHQAFASQTGQNLVYSPLLAEPEGFEQAVANFVSGGGCGMNITVPFKERAFALANETSAAAQHAGAVNTLMVQRGALGEKISIRGDNTDGIGLVRDLSVRLGFGLAGAHIVILGAGGAARGIVGPLAQAGARHILVANRTLTRAQQLVDDLADAAHEGRADCELSCCQLSDLGNVLAPALNASSVQPPSLWLNSTASSLNDEPMQLPGRALGAAKLAYDLVYSAQATAFMRGAADAGCDQVSDGLGMLVEQAAESFWLWRGQRPNTGPVFDQLRSQLR